MTIITQEICPNCGGSKWHTSWELVIFARCDSCGYIWKWITQKLQFEPISKTEGWYKVVTPECCEYAKWYLKLRYEYFDRHDREFLLTKKPYWVVRGCEFDTAVSAELKVKMDEVKFCPSCGGKLPQVRLVKDIPDKFTTCTDGGYYCGTCNERLDNCKCISPLALWELDI